MEVSLMQPSKIVFYSYRYELREDRKREAARSASNIDTLRRDIMFSFRGSSPVTTSPPTHTDKVVSNNNLALHGTLLSQQEIEILKREIVSSLKTELREMAREIVHQERPNPFPSGPPHLPPIGADLYHTHLYTQLWSYTDICVAFCLYWLYWNDLRWTPSWRMRKSHELPLKSRYIVALHYLLIGLSQINISIKENE